MTKGEKKVERENLIANCLLNRSRSGNASMSQLRLEQVQHCSKAAKSEGVSAHTKFSNRTHEILRLNFINISFLMKSLTEAWVEEQIRTNKNFKLPDDYNLKLKKEEPATKRARNVDHSMRVKRGMNDEK